VSVPPGGTVAGFESFLHPELQRIKSATKGTNIGALGSRRQSPTEDTFMAAF
jgi:hypothetical protein